MSVVRKHAGWLCGIACLPALGCVTTYEMKPRHAELRTIAVAPFFNLSPQPDVNGRAIGSAFFSELQQVDGITVIPIGVVEALLQEKRLELERPEQARQVARLLGADALVVGAITDYDPYYPPRVGIALQVYTPNGTDPTQVLSLAQLARSSHAPTGRSGSTSKPPRLRLVRIFDSSQPRVRDKVKRFAIHHSGTERPGQWRSFMRRSDDYLRFCCHEVVREVFGEPRAIDVATMTEVGWFLR